MRKVTYDFTPEPTALLKIPEYVRFFSGTTLGAFYKLLIMGIYRKSVSSLSFVNEAGYITKLARYYDSGKLACYYTDETLMESLGDVSLRTIQLHRKQLEELGLVKAEKMKEGYIYQLGKVWVSDKSERLWIENWVDRISLGKAKGPADHPETVRFRIWLTEQLCPEGKRERLLEKLRNIFRQVTQNFSPEGVNQTPVFPAPAQAKMPQAAAPRRKLSKKKEYKKDTYGDQTEELLFSGIEIPKALEDEDKDLTLEAKDKLSEMINLGDANQILAASYAAAKNGVDKGDIRAMLISGCELEFPRFPHFSLALNAPIPDKEPERDTIVRVYAALFFDVHGKHDNLGKVRTIAGNIANHYTIHQIDWTLRTLMRTGKEKELKFLVGGIQCLESILRNHTLEYTEKMDAIKNLKIQLEAQAKDAQEMVSSIIKLESVPEKEVVETAGTNRMLKRMGKYMAKKE